VRIFAIAASFLLLVAEPVAAGQGTTVWESKSGGAALNLWGSVREILRYGDQTSSKAFAAGVLASLPATTCFSAAEFANCPAFDVVGQRESWQGLTRFRIGAELRINDYLSGTVVYDNELGYGILDTFEAQVRESFAEAGSFFGAEQIITSSDRFEWGHALYRGYLRFESEHVELIVGRQRVAWGVGRLWNPIDRFSAIGPLAIEADQVRGIDSIDAKWLYDGFNYLELVYAPGTNRDRARWAARLHGVAWDADLSIMGGVFQKAPTVGIDFARNVGGAALRFELVYTDPQLPVWKLGAPAPAPLDDFFQAVVSIDGTLPIGNGITLLLEHLYNGNGLGFGYGKAGPLLPFFESAPGSTSPVPLPPGQPSVQPGSIDLFGTSRVVSGSHNQTGFQASYDLLPELQISTVVLYDWEGQSAAFFPTLRYSPFDFAEITLGAQFFVGPRLSEYGSAQHQVYLLAEVFF
jgi:hypothetical protein